MKKKKQRLSGSEAIFGFCAWLTTQKETIKMGSAEDCGSIPPLIKKFCEINKLAEPRPNWTKALTHPPKGDKNE